MSKGHETMGIPRRTAQRRAIVPRLAALLLALTVALAPAIAEARAGSSSSRGSAGVSQGSRGSRTYDGGPSGAKPMERSMTTPSPSSPAPGTFAPAPARPAFGGGFFGGSPFFTGFMGGLLGAGLAGILFGHSAWAADGMGGAGMLGLLVQLAIIGGLIWLAVRLFRSRSASPSTSYAGAAPGYGGYGAATASAPPPANPVELTMVEADYTRWGRLLEEIQRAWSRSDLNALRGLVTPEMLSWFASELADNASRGIENRVEDVVLQKGDLVEAWREGDTEYATARLTWTARDFNVELPRTGTGGQALIVSGDADRAVAVTEVWTFMRSRGGDWLLSAIQQV